MENKNNKEKTVKDKENKKAICILLILIAEGLLISCFSYFYLHKSRKNTIINHLIVSLRPQKLSVIMIKTPAIRILVDNSRKGL